LRSAGALPLGAVLAACGPQPEGGAPPAQSAKVTGKVTVVAYQKSSPKWELQQAMYADFNTEFKPKGLEVDLVNPGDDLIAKVTTLHVAGTPADMWEHPRLWRELEGLISDVTPYFKRDKIDEKQWIPESINVMKDSGGKIWGMPVSISADALAYNLDLFDQAGLKPPPVDPDDRAWTMEAFLETAKKLTKGTQQFGMQGKYTGGIDWANWPTYFGYGPVDLQQKKVTIKVPGYQQALQYWIDTSDVKLHLAPTSAELNALRSTPNQDPFLTGKIGMVGVYAMNERPQFRWGIATLPYTPNAQQPKNVSARISVHAIFQDSTSKNKDQSWEIFKYWMKPENDAKYVLSDGHVISPLLKNGSETTLNDFKSKFGADGKAFFLQAQRSKVDAWGYYLLKDWAKARGEIDTLFTDAKAGKMTVTDFTQRAQEITERTATF
jgi:multiple sugar transport system substrate-binding protein